MRAVYLHASVAHDPAVLEQLRSTDLFSGFSDEELRRVAELAEEVEAEPGALLTDQGRTGDVAYVILDGTATVTVNGERVATSRPGDTVGEMALLSHRPRNATVTADTDMKLLALDTRRFRKLVDENPRVMERINHELNARLRGESS